MKACEKCGSYAINPGRHGRDNTDQGLCDVCFWRKRAAEKERSLAETQRQIIEAAERRGYERAMSECGRGLEDARQREAQAVSDFMGQYAYDDDPGHCALDWCDSDNVDALLDAIDAARAAKGE